MAGMVLTLPTILAVNTLGFRSKQLDIPPADRIEPLEGFAERLGNAIRLRTVAPGEREPFDPTPFDAMADLLAESFPKVHERLDRQVFGGHSLLYRWQGTDPTQRPILLMSHLDVVPVEDGTEDDWTHPPYSGTIADGFIWGRGALDVKCGALGMLEAVERLLIDDFRPACDVYLAFGHDEEVGGLEGNRVIAQALQEQGVRFRFVLDEGGGLTEGIIDGINAPVAFVGIAEKGNALLDLVATGGGHSSMPPRQTAVGRLASGIARLEANPFAPRLDGATGAMLDHLGPEMPWPRRAAIANRWLTGGLIAAQFSNEPSLNALIRTTTAVTVFRGGETGNSLPGRAEARINVRLRPGDSAEAVRDRIMTLVGDDEVNIERWDVGSEASAVSSTASPSFKLLHRTIAEVYPGSIVAPGLSMVATDSRHYAAIADDIYRFLPLRVTGDDLERIHGTDERIGVEDYAALIGFLARLIRNAAAEVDQDGSATKAGGEIER